MADRQLYDQIVTVTYDILGPAADRFVSRQISNHFSKQPDELTIADLPELIEWMRLAVSFLTDDKQLIDTFTGQLTNLSHANKSVKLKHKPKPAEPQRA